MRAPKNSAKGTSGQSFVKGQFEELGWGAVPNPEHDLGTDLFVMARDERRFDVTALVGVQVKNWTLEFDKPATHEGREGWWYADDEEHFSYWLTHRVPHLVVFYDPSEKASYWAHIVEEAVVSTGKRRKIFVPKEHTVDAAHLDTLLAVALSNPVSKTWEGSAWTPGQKLPSESALRYALLAPRLVAPHGNASVESVTAPQALALVAAVRLFDIHRRYNKVQPLLAAKESAASDNTEWKLYSALFSWVDSGTRDQLDRLDAADAAPEQVAAVAAVQAASLFESGHVRRAIKMLERVLDERDDFNPVDHAWVSLHLARNLLQDGRLKRARGIALDVATIGRVAPADPTARFLAGVAADMLFTLSGWVAGDLESMIKARDNAASWWRSQKMSSGLGKHLENSFKTWANDKSVTFGASDETWTNIRSAMLISGFAAGTSSWSYEARQLGKHMLMASRDLSWVSSALHLFRLAGAKNDVKLAVDRLLNIGPVDAVVNVALDIDLKRSTRDSLYADLELLGLAGKVLPARSADRATRMLLAELANPKRRMKRLRPSNPRYDEPVALALARVVVACSEEVQAEIRSWVCALPPIDDELLARNYATLIRNIHERDWTESELKLLQARPAGDTAVFANVLERLISSRDSETRAALLDRIEQGDTSALGSWGNVTDLPEHAAAGMTQSLAQAVRADVASARKGAYSHGRSNDALRTLVLMNIWHPVSANWSACIEALSEERSAPEHLASGIDLLIQLSQKIPDAVRAELRQPLERLVSREPDQTRGSSLFGDVDLRGDALLLQALISPDDTSDDALIRLLYGTSKQTQAGIQLIAMRRDPGQLGVLAALASHDDIEVRTSVASALAEWVSLGVAGEQSHRLLTQLVNEPGVELATHVSRTFFQNGRSAGAELLADELATHPSAVVRAHVSELRRAWALEDIEAESEEKL